jgi:hypothetical protein
MNRMKEIKIQKRIMNALAVFESFRENQKLLALNSSEMVNQCRIKGISKIIYEQLGGPFLIHASPAIQFLINSEVLTCPVPLNYSILCR